MDDSPPRILKLSVEWPLVGRVMRLGTWVMLAVLTQYLVNAADTFMVGRLDGAEATAGQAALGLGMPLFWAIGGFFSAVGVGTQALVGRRYAEGDPHAAGRVLYNALIIAAIAGTGGALLGYWLTPPAIDFLAQASDEQRRLGALYTQIRMIGVPGMVLTFALKAFFDGIGRTFVHLWAALVMNVLNIGLNYLMIFGHDGLGIPAMGLAGAAYASTIATYVGLVVMIGVTLVPHYRSRYQFYRPRLFDAEVSRRIVALMIPSGSATVILMSGLLLFMRFVGQIDIDAGANVYTAATKAIMDTAGLCFMPATAIGTATATAVSQSLGAGKKNLAARYGWETIRLGVWIYALLGALLFAFPEQILSAWSPNDPAVAIAGANGLRLCAASLPFMVVGIVLAQALYGAGANVYVASVELLLHLGVLVPLSWLLGPHLGYGLEGIWSALWLYVVLLGVAMGAKFAGRGWREIEL